MIRRAFDWLFRSRESGKIVVAQLPNPPLLLFLVASAVKRFADPPGRLGAVVGVAAVGSLLWWAGDEVLRGVNPFRRLLGAVVAVATLGRLLLG
jgi:hypothetical protein